MLQVSYIRQNRDKVLQRLAIKNFLQIQLVDEIIAIDDERKKVQAAFDNTQARVNNASREIGNLMRLGQKEQAESLDRKSTRLNSSHANISYAVFCLKKKKTIN